VNIGDQPWPDPVGAARRVRDMQIKLHHWAVSDPGRRFDDVFNLVHHPDFLTVAWARVRGNKGARTAGVDRVSPATIAEDDQVEEFLGQVRELLRSAMDRVVQASLLLVLEPIFEADFKPVSYGFRPGRRAQDAIAEIHALGSRKYLWVFEADIAACLDACSYCSLPDCHASNSVCGGFGGSMRRPFRRPVRT